MEGRGDARSFSTVIASRTSNTGREPTAGWRSACSDSSKRPFGIHSTDRESPSGSGESWPAAGRAGSTMNIASSTWRMTTAFTFSQHAITTENEVEGVVPRPSTAPSPVDEPGQDPNPLEVEAPVAAVDDDAAPVGIPGQRKRSDEKSHLKGVEPAPDRLLRDAHVIGERREVQLLPGTGGRQTVEVLEGGQAGEIVSN